MIITTYICDNCGNEVLCNDLYSVTIKPGIESYGGGYSIMNCAPSPYKIKHICSHCLKGMFPDII